MDLPVNSLLINPEETTQLKNYQPSRTIKDQKIRGSNMFGKISLVLFMVFMLLILNLQLIKFTKFDGAFNEKKECFTIIFKDEMKLKDSYVDLTQNDSGLMATFFQSWMNHHSERLEARDFEYCNALKTT